MFDEPTFPPVAETDRNTADYHNDLLRKISRLSRQQSENLGLAPASDRRGLAPVSTFLAQLLDAACDTPGHNVPGTDARYNAQRLVPAYTLTRGDVAYGVVDTINPGCFVATNLGELPVNPGPSAAGTHLLRAGQQVMVTGFIARTRPQQVFYFFDHAVPATFPALITGATRDASIPPNFQWTYTIAEAEKTSAGYGGWTVKSGGRTGTAYNGMEVPNGASGLMGTGVDTANLAGTGLALQPITTGVKVDVTTETVAGVAEFWFSQPNGTDGPCDPPE